LIRKAARHKKMALHPTGGRGGCGSFTYLRHPGEYSAGGVFRLVVGSVLFWIRHSIVIVEPLRLFHRV